MHRKRESSLGARLVQRALGGELTTAFAWLAVGAVGWGAAAARAQCSPRELAKLTASDAAASDWFGHSIAVSSDTIVIGALGDSDAGSRSGSAYVFVRSGDVWTEQAKLTASDAEGGDLFGVSVALSGDTAIVGAHGDNNVDGASVGAAYVFVRSGGVWTQQAKLIASDAETGDQFGFSVALSGDTAIIGACSDGDAYLSEIGSAYAFVRSDGAWTEQAKLTASNATRYDWFGYSVAVSGDTALIGSYEDAAAGGRAGSARVFERSGGVWTQRARLTASDGSGGDSFGFSVAVSGGTALVGAFKDDNSGGYHAGSAYVFVDSDDGWIEQSKLTAADATSGDRFGISVALSGDIAVVGANGDDLSGSACVFVRSNSVWTQQPVLTASDAERGDFFGWAVAVSGDLAAIGAVFDTNAGGNDAGAAYVFELNCCTGDLNGDGTVGVVDLTILLAHFGGAGNPGDGDLDGDGDMDLQDLANLLASFGTTCP